jgi:heterodisulfide reductase subunit A-like polyferredoxin
VWWVVNLSGIAVVLCECSKKELLEYVDLPKIEKTLRENLQLSGLLKCSSLCSKRIGLPILSALIKQFDKIIVLGCYPRAQKWLFIETGIGKKLVSISIRGSTTKRVIIELAKKLKKRKDLVTEWFPVIDRNLCTNCGECKEFCLFGVFGENKNGEIFVANPYNCKDNCPACARVCPEGAIIFPKCPEDWIAGADVNPPPYKKMTKEELQGELMKIQAKYFKPETIKKVSKEIKRLLEVK